MMHEFDARLGERHGQALRLEVAYHCFGVFCVGESGRVSELDGDCVLGWVSGGWEGWMGRKERRGGGALNTHIHIQYRKPRTCGGPVGVRRLHHRHLPGAPPLVVLAVSLVLVSGSACYMHFTTQKKKENKSGRESERRLATNPTPTTYIYTYTVE